MARHTHKINFIKFITEQPITVKTTPNLPRKSTVASGKNKLLHGHGTTRFPGPSVYGNIQHPAITVGMGLQSHASGTDNGGLEKPVLDIPRNSKLSVDGTNIPFTYEIKSSHIKHIITYMLTNYSNEISCINITHNALAKLGINKTEPQNFAEYPDVEQFKNMPASVFIIRLDILSVDEDLLKQFGGTHGDHIHSLLIAVDSNTDEYQILMAFNHSYSLNDFYNGQLPEACKDKVFHKGSIGSKDISSFKEYHNNNIIPYAGHGFAKLVNILKTLTTTPDKMVMLAGDALDKLNILCGFANFNTNYDADIVDNHGCFNHNIKGLGTSYSVLRYEMAVVNPNFLAS